MEGGRKPINKILTGADGPTIIFADIEAPGRQG
jgi:hypothetical protein